MKLSKNTVTLFIVGLISILFAHATHAAQDNAIMFEFGFGLGHMKESKMLVTRFRHENTMLHVGTWFGGNHKSNVVAGIGFYTGSPVLLRISDGTDVRVGMDAGLAVIFNDSDQPLQLYAHGMLGVKTTEQFDTHLSLTSYLKNENSYRTFLTGGVTRVWDRNAEFDGRGNRNLLVDDCDYRPGHGHGDKNHCHDGPPGDE